MIKLLFMTVTAKLTTLNTTEDPRMVEEDNNIVAFIDVLKCSREEATFYLESSAWNIETAILLWIENNPSPSYQTYNPWGSSDPAAAAASSYSHYYNHALLNTASSAFSQSTLATAVLRPPRQWYSREVLIQDFPKDWSARVSRSSGQIYFVHLLTGRRQYSVPPGYADIHTDMSPNDCDDLCDTKTEVLIDVDDNPTQLSPDDEGPLDHDDQTSLSSLLTHRFKGDYNMLTTAESLPGAAATTATADPSMLIDSNSSNNQNYFTKNDEALEGGEDMTIDYASRSNASSTRALHDENSVYTITNDLDDRPVSDVMYNNSDLSSSSYRHGKGSYIAGEAFDGSMESSLDAYFAASGSNSSSISNK